MAPLGELGEFIIKEGSAPIGAVTAVWSDIRTALPVLVVYKA